MDLTKTLETLDQMLAGPKLTPMTKEQFEAYAQDQIAKAKAEAEEDDKEAGAEKAKKRLEHLRNTMATLAKAEGTPLTGAWTGDNGTALIPEFEHGRDDTTRKKEISSTAVATPPVGNQGTQGDGATAFAGNTPSFDQQPNAKTPAGTALPPSGQGTQSNNSAFEGSSMEIGKQLESIGKLLNGVAAPVVKNDKDGKTQTQKSAPDYAWPKDLADGEYLKDGVTKRAPDHWGGDAEAPAK